MPIAAVPAYMGNQFSEASPGLRFGLYLPVWMTRADQERTVRADQERTVRDRAGRKSPEALELAARLEREGMDAVIADLECARKNPLTRRWHKDRQPDSKALGRVMELGGDDRARMNGWIARQSALARTVAATGRLLTLEARSTAPFTTGLGNEHPLENGFAFLNPYGLPYLAGSGIKGVLRTAARELASGEWGDSSGWDDEAIEALFGHQDSNDAQRGALCFWDVMPRLRTGKLAIEVMTGHQSHYYQKGESPHESASPVPVFFLTVPAGAEFTFHVSCDEPFLARTAPGLAEDKRWKSLLEAAFVHAFAWLGFGAKTAVGYGAMELDQHKLEQARKQAAEEEARRRAEAEEKARREREEAERAARQAEFEQLPAERKLLVRLEECLTTMEELPATAREPSIAEFNTLRKELEAEGPGWSNAEYREHGAKLLERFYDLTGWHQSGVKADKKKKQEKKKRDMIARLRKGS